MHMKQIFHKATHVTHSVFYPVIVHFLMLLQPTKLIYHPLTSDDQQFEKPYYYLYCPVILSFKDNFTLFALYSYRRKFPNPFPIIAQTPQYFSHFLKDEASAPEMSSALNCFHYSVLEAVT